MRGDTGRKDRSSEAQHYWRDSDCKMFPAVCKDRQFVFRCWEKKDTLQYESVKCIREQILYINSILNEFKSIVSKLWELKFKISFNMDENRRFFTEMEPEALERRLRLTQSPSCRHQAQEGQWWHHANGTKKTEGEGLRIVLGILSLLWYWVVLRTLEKNLNLTLSEGLDLWVIAINS